MECCVKLSKFPELGSRPRLRIFSAFSFVDGVHRKHPGVDNAFNSTIMRKVEHFSRVLLGPTLVNQVIVVEEI